MIILHQLRAHHDIPDFFDRNRLARKEVSMTSHSAPHTQTTAAALILLLAAFSAVPAAAGCGKTTFHPVSPFVPANEVHDAFYLTDPTGQQRAVFDLEWGGVLASLTQSGTERLWGHATGGMVQPTFHTLTPDYNPTPAGDGASGNRGTPVLGARCVDANKLLILSGTTDYNAGRSGNIIANTVKYGDTVSGMYATPYTVTTTAIFVANPSAPPSYYLKLDQVITNIHPTESLAWGFELAGYVPYSYTWYVRYPSSCDQIASNCYTSSTPHILGGLYPSGSLTGGDGILCRASAVVCRKYSQLRVSQAR